MKRILVVEDNAELAKLLELILRRAGYEISLAEDGNEALTRFAEDHPDLVLLDIMLPRMDGYEVATHIRGDLHSEVPIIMLSSLDTPLDMQRSRTAGATTHVAKPFNKDELLVTIAAYLDGSEAGEAAA